MATSMATLRGLGCVPTFAGSSCVRRPAAARRAGAVARRTEARNGIASPLVGTGVLARRRGRPSVAPVAALGADAADALANIAPHVDAAATLAAARVAELADAAAALDASAFDAASGSSFADALDAVSGAASDAAEETGAQRMEGILSPISDRLEAFVLGTQALFEKQGVPYPLGSSIIFTTFVVKALTYPFTKSQVEATLNIQNLAPQTDAVREKYKDDPERMNIEINRLYEENQVSPLAGCVPILLTLPVVWGLYRAFNNASIDGSFDEPWFFIPSLAGPSPDRTLAWLLPLDENYAPPIGWHDAGLYLIVPILTVASQYVSMEILKPPKDVNKDPDAPDPNDSVLLQLLPLFIGYVSLTVPAGLTLYWLFNNLFTTATQVYLRQGGGAVAKIEKSENVVVKVPLGCAVVDLSTAQTQPRDAPYEGPYIIYGDEGGEADAVDSDRTEDSFESIAAAAASSTGAFYTTPEERSAATAKWASLLENRGTRARNPADREMATVAELEAVIAEFKQGGFEQEAQEVADALSALNAMGGDDGIAKLVERGKQTRAEEEKRAMRDAVGANEEDETASGLPSLEELNSAR
jgi:YidC/Oxa1 family membrane protein insertase